MAAPRCQVCLSAERTRIDAALVAGTTFAALSRAYGLSEDALARHAARHLPLALVKSQRAAEVARADDLLARIEGLEEDARRLGRKAEAQGDLRAALVAVRELVRICEVLARLRLEAPPPEPPAPVYDWSRVHDVEKLRIVREVLQTALVGPGDRPPERPALPEGPQGRG